MLPEELFAKLPFRLPEEDRRMLDRNGLLGSDWFIYRSDRDYDWITERTESCVSVTCPQCGDRLYADKVYRVNGCGAKQIGFSDGRGMEYFSKDSYECPYCGATGKAVHCSDVSRYGTCIKEIFVGRCYNIDGYAVVASYFVNKTVNKEGVISLNSGGIRAYLICDGKMYMAVGFQRGYRYNISLFSDWQIRKRTTFPDLELSYLFPVSPGLLDGTDAENCHIDRYILDAEKPEACYPHVYLALWLRHRNIENLVMSGCTRMLNILLEEHAEKSYYNSGKFHLTIPELNWRKNRPCDMLRLDKPAWKRMQAEQWSYRKYVIYSTFSSNGIRLDEEQLDKLLYSGYQVDIYRDMFERNLNPFHVLNYLEQQKKPHNGYSAVPDYRYLTDYWNLIEKCGEEVTPDRQFPKNLTQAHDRQSERYQAVKDEALNARIKAKGAVWNRLSFADEKLGYLIRPCADYPELINEGKQLHHCVATYAESIASGRTSIFFIRKQAEPEKPFFTLELEPKKRTVLQNRGLRNCDRTPEITQFEAEWLQHIQEVKAI